jgi:hypothetical protein
VLDLGCGPGAWLRRIVERAGNMGCTRITGRGVDVAEAQVRRARFLSQASRVLEHRLRRNPTFVDHATHLPLIGRPKRS